MKVQGVAGYGVVDWKKGVQDANWSEVADVWRGMLMQNGLAFHSGSKSKRMETKMVGGVAGYHQMVTFHSWFPLP